MSTAEKVKRSIVQIIILLLFMMMLLSCSGQWHLNRAIRKDPTLFEDTVRTADTLFREIVVPVYTDRTVFVNDTAYITQYDTITKDSLRVEIINLPGDSIKVEVDCPDCPEITKTETVTVVERLTFWDKVWFGLPVFAIGVVVGIFIWIFLKLS